MDTTKNRKLIVGGAAAAFVLGAGAVAGAAVGAGPFERDDSGFDSPSDTSEATSVSTPDTLPDDNLPSGGVDGARTEATSFADIPVGGSSTFAAGAAGFVTVARDADGVLRVVAVSPAAGWVFEIEPGDELGEAEVDFRNGVSRVQFNAEVEDGVVRIRVRTRGAAAVPAPDGTVPRVDNSGPGSANSGPGSANSGPGSVDDNGGSSGPGSGGSDDTGFDDHGGSSGSGSGGSDDTGIDDHGGGGGHSGSGSSGSGSSGSGGHGSDD